MSETPGSAESGGSTEAPGSAEPAEPVESTRHRRSARQHHPRYLDNALTGNEVFDLLDDFIIDSDGGAQQRKRRKRPRTDRGKKASSSSSSQGKKAAQSNGDRQDSSNKAPPPPQQGKARPRWYNQMYVMFLALRQSPNHTASRSELVRKAVELDGRISRDRGLPRAFTGKTPMNSASALLTNNGDRHFVQFRPPGARCYHFRLAYNPGDFDSALAAYNSWVDVLVTKDWPVCFGPPNPDPDPDHPAAAEADPAKTDAPAAAKIPAAAADDPPKEAPAAEDAAGSCGHGAAGDKEDPGPTYDIPKGWRDIVEVRPSTIPHAGNGLFAVRDLPAGTPLGFYFGVPMTEDEFDSLKEPVGMSSHYSIMYRKTVLDATDEHGMPYTDPDGPLYCPFHFMNEARAADGMMPGRCNIAFLEGIQVNQIICLAARDIASGEELFVSYGSEVDRSHWDGNNNNNKNNDDNGNSGRNHPVQEQDAPAPVSASAPTATAAEAAANGGAPDASPRICAMRAAVPTAESCAASRRLLQTLAAAPPPLENGDSNNTANAAANPAAPDPDQPESALSH